MIPDSDHLVMPALTFLVHHTDLTFRPLRSMLEDQFGLSPSEKQERTESGEFVMSAALHSALTRLISEGLVIKITRNDYQPTDRGREVVAAARGINNLGAEWR